MFNSTEKKIWIVSQLYQTIQSREPDLSGLNSHVQNLQHNFSYRHQLIHDFKKCDEKFNRFLQTYLDDDRFSESDKEFIRNNQDKIKDKWKLSTKLLSLRDILSL